MQQESRVVLDTNLIISAAISADGAPARIFELVLEKKITNYISDEIIEEIEEVFDRPYIKGHISEEYKRLILDNLKNLSIKIKPTFNESAVAEDPKDNKFINCALSAKADIVSGDKHLLQLGTYGGITIFDVNAFLDLFNR
ncbi:MAG TPA: putative toxin-antitoxin system toxin component, PIN family [Candidatus Nanoarchaeia archaeon]|nr:putative toxin-antitoxin system toxin component, PIN family [Candidatus Nanoarchaeia archaeon]